MSTGAIISMVIILGIVIGGFLYFLSVAIKKEKQK
ncbi:MAG: MetS family NSS transporter small subunit [Cyclobacteriaceae bacterium]